MDEELKQQRFKELENLIKKRKAERKKLN